MPVVKGAEAGLNNAFMKQIADNLSKSQYHQNFYDQSLGPSVGRVVNDVTAEIAGGSMTPSAGRHGDPAGLEAGQLSGARTRWRSAPPIGADALRPRRRWRRAAPFATASSPWR